MDFSSHILRVYASTIAFMKMISDSQMSTMDIAFIVVILLTIITNETITAHIIARLILVLVIEAEVVIVMMIVRDTMALTYQAGIKIMTGVHDGIMTTNI